MTHLDDWIKEHHASFDEEPLTGHEHRFQNRLATPKRIVIGKWSPYLQVVASLLLVLLTTDLIMHLKGESPRNMARPNQPAELVEASLFYTSKINGGIGDLERMASEGIGTSQEVHQIKRELKEMDSLFINLQQEYKQNPNDERIINAMIEYYQSKLEIINTIKSDLEQVKKLKSEKNENREI